MGILKFAVRDLANFRIGEKKMIRDRNLMLGFLFDAREYIIVIPGGGLPLTAMDTMMGGWWVGVGNFTNHSQYYLVALYKRLIF